MKQWKNASAAQGKWDGPTGNRTQFTLEHFKTSQADPSMNEDMQCVDKVNVEIILEKHKPTNNLEKTINNYKCASCGFRTRSLSELSSHKATCDQRRQFSCSMCKQSFSSNKGIQRHIMKQHLSTWICHFCNVTFSEEHEYTSHLGTHLTNSNGDSRPVQAKQNESGDGESSSISQSPGQVRQHYKCSICEYRTTNKQFFHEHVRSHVVLKLFKCEECGNRFRNQELLMKHLKTCPQSLSSRCSYCGLEFLSTSDMVEHMKSHNTFEESCSADGDVLEILGVQNSFSNELGLVDCEKRTSLEGLNDDGLDQPSSEVVDVFQCNVCFQTFISKLQFDDHQKGHNSKFFTPPKDLEQADVNSMKKENVDSGTYSSTDVNYENKTERVFEEMLKRIDSDKKLTNEISSKNSLGIVFNCFCGASFNDQIHYEKHKTEKHTTNNDIFKDEQCVIKNSSIQITSLLNDDSVQVYGSHLMETLEKFNVGNASIGENGLVNIISCEGGGAVSEPLNGMQYVFDIGTGENITVMNSKEVLDNVPSECFENESETLDLQEMKTGITSLEGVQEKAYLCAVCGYHSPNLADLKMHFTEHKNMKSHSSLTKEKYSHKRKLTLQFKNEKSSGKLICLHCLNKFNDRQTLHQHILDSHTSERYCCSFCDQRFPSKKALKIHEDTHSDKLLYKCDSCSQRFSKEKQLKHHKDIMHRDPHCRYCGKEIQKAQTLKNHEMRHAREAGNFECDICKRIFKTKTGLRHHVATHTGEYKFCCDYCGRGFMSRMMMEEHRSKHTKEERYICDVCGRKFSFQSTYWIHRKWHDTPYPYKCNFCGRMFRHSSLLAVHKRKHTGERPYKCSQCSLTFPVGGTLKRHMILHTGMYPFNCDKCNRGFTTKHKYASHLAKVHSDYDLLNSKPLQSDFKMVVREEPMNKQEDVLWRVQSDGMEQNMLNFKVANLPESESPSRSTKDGLQCPVANNVLVDNIIPTRVVEIVLDEGSQAMATVTLAEHGSVPELWYPQ
ncbi:hypothetical protein PR048_022191 [Dryococelus australis]|uniref:C2H2-type domain-containing protein n=1 Tax=Dryococelus australis TaxID=614101 RepID=A0ABQ9H0C9_9NEOP|nr:hypothetical protein PR048_022191 [Dryococelus australis]